MTIDVYNLPSLQLRVSPLAGESVTCIRALNVNHDLIGALNKRPGIIKYLGTPDNAKVTSLFNWTRNSGTQFWNYRVSGGSLYYSTQGTGAWTICGNGTLTAGAVPGYAVLEDTLIIGDGTAPTRHSTDGTSFTNTTSAPIAQYFDEFQNRIWAGGTASSAFYSNVGTPSDWINDSSSLTIPGPGRINSVFKADNRVNFTKNSGNIFKYDGFAITDQTTTKGPSNVTSLCDIEDVRAWLNRDGYYSYDGNQPRLISSPIRKQIFNDRGSGIDGTVFDYAPAAVYQYDMYSAVGTVTEDLTDETINRLVEVYDFQLNEWHNYEYSVLPTAFLSFKDINSDEQLIFGASTGQCYQVSGTANDDDGTAITSVMEYVVRGDNPHLLKKWNYLWMFFNPGCQAKIQVSFADTFVKGKKIWQDLGDAKSGNVEFRLPEAARSKFMFIKISESSTNARFSCYGFSVDAEEIQRR